MPWCPKCKAEYQPGVTMCSDCKVELVEELKDALIPFFQAEDKKVAEKLVKFFQYSDLDSSVKYDADNDIYIVSIDPKKQMEAKKLYQAFYFVERERMEKGESDIFTAKSGDEAAADKEENEAGENETGDADADSGAEVSETDTDSGAEVYEAESEDRTDLSSEEEDTENPDDAVNETPGDEINAFDDDDIDDASPYVMKADQYKDLSGTVWIFLIFGIAGILFVLLNVIGVISVLSGWIANTVMGALFLFFIYVALSTNQKAKKIQAEIEEENKLTANINEWLKVNVTEEFLTSISDENASRELNYLKQTDMLKEMLIKEFGSQNLAYLDRLIEEYYSNTFENIME